MSRSPAEGSEREMMDKLLTALRDVAREEDAAAAACPDAQVPEISAALRTQITAAALRQLAGGPGAEAGAAQPAPATRPVASGGDQLAVRREQHARLRSPRLTWSLGTAVLAAAAALVLWNRAPTTPAAPDGAGALPDYAVTASGGLADTRGGNEAAGSAEGAAPTTTAPVRLNDSSELRVVCRPDSAVVGAVTARAFVVRDGVATEVVPEAKVAPTGAVELRLRGAQLHGASPTGALRVVVGRPDAIRAVAPGDAVGAGRSRPDQGAGRRWLTVPLDLDGQQR